MRGTYAIAIILLISGAILGGAAIRMLVPIRGPLLSISPATIDFGACQNDAPPLVKTVSIANGGDRTLQLQYVGSTCGCAVVRSYPATLEAGASDSISVVITPPKSHIGPNHQSLLFRTNDVAHPSFRLNAMWQVEGHEELQISPENVELEIPQSQLLHQSGTSCFSVFIRSRSGELLHISQVVCSPHLLTQITSLSYGCTGAVPCDGKAYHITRIDVKVLPMPVGPFHEWIKFATGVSARPLVSIPVDGRIISSASREVPGQCTAVDVPGTHCARIYT